MANGGERGDAARARTRFHGRVEGRRQRCDQPGCAEPGEFRAPPGDGPRAGFDGPGAWRWLCLDHVRAFNDRYNYFAGMSTDEIESEQRPYAGWERETRAFATGAGTAPRWADFTDPLDAIQARFRAPPRDRDGRPIPDADRRALRVLDLEPEADRHALRKRYSELVRRYHPDRNGGDRSHEGRLTEVIAAYERLRKSSLFA